MTNNTETAPARVLSHAKAETTSCPLSITLTPGGCHDPDHLTYMVHELVNGLSYQLNRRARGYLDKLDRAIEDGVRVGEGSSAALRLSADARILRLLADALDERCGALVGVAPRLRLVAAE